jgi:hypothetical protein
MAKAAAHTGRVSGPDAAPQPMAAEAIGGHDQQQQQQQQLQQHQQHD